MEAVSKILIDPQERDLDAKGSFKSTQRQPHERWMGKPSMAESLSKFTGSTSGLSPTSPFSFLRVPARALLESNCGVLLANKLPWIQAVLLTCSERSCNQSLTAKTLAIAVLQLSSFKPKDDISKQTSRF